MAGKPSSSSGAGKVRRADTGTYTTKKHGQDDPKTIVTEHDKKRKS